MFSRAFLSSLRHIKVINPSKSVNRIILTNCNSTTSFHTSNILQRKDDATSNIPAATKEKKLLLQQNDPDVFGTLTDMRPFDGKQTTEEEDLTKLDPLDVVESELTENIPFKTQRLTVKGYADLIKNHFKHRRVKEAIDVLEVKMLKEDRVKPNDYLFNLVISGCAKLGYHEKAFKLYNRMKERDLKISGATYTALFNACAESPLPQKALEHANNLRKIMLKVGYIPNETNYNAMIKAYGRCGDIETAFRLVDEMKDNKLLLKLGTISFLLQACASDKDYGFRHALLVWHKMHKLGLSPNKFTFGLMLRCTRDCGIGDVHTMRQVILQILSNAEKNKNKFIVKQDEEALQIVAKENKPDQGLKQIESNEKVEETKSTEESLANVPEEICDQTPNLLSRTPHLGSLVALSAVNSPSDRLLLLGGMSSFLQELKSFNVKPDVKLFTCLLEVIPPTRAAENKLIEIMRNEDVMTDVDFFNILMKKRAMRFDYNAANEVLSMIKAVRLEPNIVTYGVMCLGCKTAQEAQDMLQILEDAGVKPNMIILGSMLKNACYLKNYDYVLEILHIAQREGLKPSAKFLQIIDNFNRIRFLTLRGKISKHDQNEYFRFSREYKKWQKDMNIQDSKEGMEKAIKSADEHPWKQFKEKQPKGIEHIKNVKKFRRSKTKHKLYKLTGNRLNTINETPNEKVQTKSDPTEN